MASRVTIVEDSLAGRLLLSSLFAAGHYTVSCTTSGDLFVTDGDAAEGLLVLGPCVDAGALLASIAEKEGGHRAPCLVLGRDMTPDVRLALIAQGAHDVLEYPVPEALLLARARSVLREAETFRELDRRRQATRKFGFAEATTAFATPKSVVWIDGRSRDKALPDLGTAKSWSVLVAGVANVLAPDGLSQAPSGYILDWSVDGPQSPMRNVLPELRAREHSRHAGILVIHDPDDPASAVQALDAGASEVVPASAHGHEIGLRLSRMLRQKVAEDALRRSNEASLELAVTDPLTGLYNRRYAEAYLTDLVADRDPGRPFAVMIADIDRFKSINDTFGHAIGDEVLRTIAKRLRSEMRALDLVARFGGEEFLIVLAESNLDQARRAADRLRRRVGDTPVQLGDGSRVDVTLSIGVSLGDGGASPETSKMPDKTSFPWGGGVMADLLTRADGALYRAKECGRDRVQMAATSGGTP